MAAMNICQGRSSRGSIPPALNTFHITTTHADIQQQIYCGLMELEKKPIVLFSEQYCVKRLLNNVSIYYQHFTQAPEALSIQQILVCQPQSV